MGQLHGVHAALEALHLPYGGEFADILLISSAADQL